MILQLVCGLPQTNSHRHALTSPSEFEDCLTFYLPIVIRCD